MANEPEWIEPPRTQTPSPDERARVAYLQMVYGQASLAAVLSVVVLALLCVGLWDAADHAALLIWLALASVVALLRYGLILGFHRRRPDAGTARWEQWFVASLVLASLVWGVGGWWVMPSESPLHQVLVYSFLLGMAGGTTALYSSLKTGAILANFCFLTPATVWLALQSDLHLRILALGGVLFTAAASRAIAMLGRFIRRSFELSNELERSREAAERLARTDELTGLLNRRAFYEMGDYLVEQAARHKRPVALLLMDVDSFKEINDHHGHVAGDAALRSLAEVLRGAGRRIDVVGRLGGDEFAILLPDSTAESAITLAERVRSELPAIEVGDGGESLLTCSMGIAGGISVGSLETLIRSSDRALYEAKDAGRNRIVQV